MGKKEIRQVVREGQEEEEVMPLKGVRYRYRKGTHIRLAFRGNTVVEAKNMKTKKTHTPAEFKADRKRKRKGARRKSRR